MRSPSEIRALMAMLVACALMDGQQGDMLEKQEAALQADVQAHPGDGFAHYQFGLLCRQRGDNRRASEQMQLAIKNGFANQAARINLMEAAFAAHESVLGLATADEILKGRASVDTLLRLGRTLFEHLFYRDALTSFERAYALDPEQYEVRFRLALTQYLLEDYAGALQTLERPGMTPEAASLAAAAEAESGQREAAIARLKKVIQQMPQSAHAYMNLALIELDAGNTSAAENWLTKLRDLGSTAGAKVFYRVRRYDCKTVADGASAIPEINAAAQGDADLDLAEQLTAGYQFSTAVAIASLAQRHYGNSARLLLIAGESCLNQNSTSPDTLTLLKAASERAPNSAVVFELLGRAFARQGAINEAIEAFRKAAALHPDPSYYVSLGKLLSDKQAAVVEFKRALLLAPANAQAHLELGRAYADLGKREMACEEFKKALDLEPDFYEADYLLGLVLRQLGDLTAASTAMKRFSEKKAALSQQAVLAAGYSVSNPQ